MTDLPRFTLLEGGIKHVPRHVRLDQARADRVYANVGLLQLVYARLRDRVDAVLGM